MYKARFRIRAKQAAVPKPRKDARKPPKQNIHELNCPLKSDVPPLNPSRETAVPTRLTEKLP